MNSSKQPGLLLSTTLRKFPDFLEVVTRTMTAYTCLLEKEMMRYILREKRLLAYEVLMCLKDSL
jgi:hypothetical protein